MLAFADRAIDTAEDIFMHATRAFKPAEKMNLPLSDGDGKPPLTATKKERIVVLGTGWGGHAISKVRDGVGAVVPWAEEWAYRAPKICSLCFVPSASWGRVRSFSSRYIHTPCGSLPQ